MVLTLRYLGPGLLLLVILFGFTIMSLDVSARADQVIQGQNVNPAAPTNTLIDIRANRAEAAWLGDTEMMPAELRSPYLMYLGQGVGRRRVLVVRPHDRRRPSRPGCRLHPPP
jgi:hypothetical protein